MTTAHPNHRARPSIYRHWLEAPVLFFTFLILIATPLLLGGLNAALQALAAESDPNQRTLVAIVLAVVFALFLVAGIVAAIFMTLWSARRRLNQLRRGAVRVGPAQFPALHAEAQAVRAALAVTKRVEVYLVDGRWLSRPIAPISVLGVTSPYAIVIDAALVQEMSLAELRFLLAVEYGHVRLGHVRILTMIDAVSGSLGRVPFVGGFVRVLFSAWTYLATYSADRAGLVAGGNLAAAYSALGKLAVGGALWGEINHQALAQQALRQRGRFFDLGNRLTAPFDTQPMGRFQRLVAFSATPTFRSLCPDADLSLPGAEAWQTRTADDADR
ncbi:MAG: M48 family metallopeptidase [Caldilinea sp.]|nr:M48 family metallopeptidase [Caldilinea sp.]